MQGAAMTIDERLEKLTERHEALTQSVELLHSMHRDNEERWEKRFGQVTHDFEIVLDSIKRLENIAAAH
jgi:hypothetical protein